MTSVTVNGQLESAHRGFCLHQPVKLQFASPSVHTRDRPIHRPADIIGRFLRFLRVSASADAGCCVRRSGIIYRHASTGSSVLLETLQEMAEQKTNPVWQHFTEQCSTSHVFNICQILFTCSCSTSPF